MDGAGAYNFKHPVVKSVRHSLLLGEEGTHAGIYFQ